MVIEKDEKKNGPTGGTTRLATRATCPDSRSIGEIMMTSGKSSKYEDEIFGV